jgi:hypothetical protein
VALENDLDTINVGTPEVLSQEESELLRQQLTVVDGFSEEALLHNFATASVFIHNI